MLADIRDWVWIVTGVAWGVVTLLLVLAVIVVSWYAVRFGLRARRVAERVVEPRVLSLARRLGEERQAARETGDRFGPRRFAFVMRDELQPLLPRRRRRRWWERALR